MIVGRTTSCDRALIPSGTHHEYDATDPRSEVEQLAADIPDEPGKLLPHWFEGPHNADRLDAAVVTVSAGGSADRISTSAVR